MAETDQLARLKRLLLETSEREHWNAAVGIGLVDVEDRTQGVIVTVSAQRERDVRSWLDTHPQSAPVRVEVVDRIDARSESGSTDPTRGTGPRTA